jgi:hypothetical protein
MCIIEPFYARLSLEALSALQILIHASSDLDLIDGSPLDHEMGADTGLT